MPSSGDTIIVPRGDPVPPGYVPISASDSGGETYVYAGNNEIPTAPGAEMFLPGYAATTQESTEDAIRAILKYSPFLAQQQYNQQAKFTPLQAQLAQDVAAQFLPQQYQLGLDLQAQYGPQYQQLAQEGITAARYADIADVQALAGTLPGIQDAAMDPETLALRNALISQVSADLAMGTQLTPEQARLVEQSQLSAEQAQGINSGQGTANRQAVAMAIEGQDLQTQRQNQAMNVLGQEYANDYDPFDAILGRPSSAPTQGQVSYQTGLPQPVTSGQPINGQNAATQGTQIGSQNAANAYNAAMAQSNAALAQQQYALQYQLAQQAALQQGVNPYGVSY